jgi:hypothetical protein
MTTKAEAKLIALSAATKRARQQHKRAQRKLKEAERKLQELEHFRLEWLIDRARDVIDRFDRLDSEDGDDFYLARPRWKDLSRLAPMVRKAKRRAEASRDAAERANENRRETTQRQKKIARNLADNLLRKNRVLRLPRKKSELALQVRRVWPQHETAPATNTIRHWLAKAYPEK